MLSLGFWGVDRTTGLISEYLARAICGDRLMKPVGGITGDVGCGFNTDLHLTAALGGIFLLGLALHLTRLLDRKDEE